MKLAALTLAATSLSVVAVALYTGSSASSRATTAENLPPSTRTAKTVVPDGAADRLLQAYDDVFNDLEMLNDGRFGLSRMYDPPDQHIGLRGQSYAAKGSDKARENPIAVARKNFRELSVAWNEGVVSMLQDRPAYKEEEYRGRILTQHRFSPEPVRHKNWIALWKAHDTENKLFASFGPANSVAPAALIQLGADIRSWAADPKNRGKQFEKRIGEWELKARAVPFRHRECISCHPKAKIGDPAAVAVVATRDRA
ncbi:MAG: hypothetical protein AB7F50_02265 [Fimbriimonadaceae bacterium]